MATDNDTTQQKTADAARQAPGKEDAPLPSCDNPLQGAASKDLFPGITGVVLTFNGERLLDKCLASLDFCQEILAVDSGSTDATHFIVQQHKGVLVTRQWEGFASQFDFAQSRVNTEWFFVLDQDEICPPELAKAILRAVGQVGDDQESNAFSVGRISWYFNRFMRHTGWYPDHLLRVFRTGKAVFTQDAHIQYDAPGKKRHLGGPGAEIIHYPYTGFDNQWAKLNMYARQGADHMLARGKRGGIAKALGHGLWRFLKLYFLKKGFMDGAAGFLASVHGAMYAFEKYIRPMRASWGKPYNWERQLKK